jgi:hypothetical protein
MSVDNLAQTLPRLRDEGIVILSGPRKVSGMRPAFVQGPDGMQLEIVEGHAKK